MRNLFGFGLVLATTFACTTFEDFKLVGKYTYEGAEYDVYQAWRDDFMLGSEQAYVAIPKGVPPVAAAVVATCSADGNTLATCEQSFGRQIARLTSTTERDEGGMY